MKSRPTLAVVLASIVAGSLVAETPSPTPAAARRKLAGGSFGTVPAPTPARESSRDSLVEAARKAQDDAGTASAPSRKIVITNESLGKTAPTPVPSSITITGRAGAKPVVKARPTATPSAFDAPGSIPPYRDASGRTEADWRQLAGAARERLTTTQSVLDAANAETRRLENDFYAWSDGNYRERVIRPAWDQAKERAKKLEEEVEKARAAIADLEEEARKSGTPPGWLR